MRPKKPSGFASGFAGFVHRIMGSAAVGLVHGRPDKRASLVDLVHASGTTKQNFLKILTKNITIFISLIVIK